jgi:lysozyme family protein
VAWLLEKFNGFGYREYHHIPSPYLWGGTVVQKPGKYVRDKHYDPTVMDEQIGGMALLAALMQLDPSVKFEEAVTA